MWLARLAPCTGQFLAFGLVQFASLDIKKKKLEGFKLPVPAVKKKKKIIWDYTEIFLQ